MNEQLKTRLDVLKSEFESGQKALVEMGEKKPI